MEPALNAVEEEREGYNVCYAVDYFYDFRHSGEGVYVVRSQKGHCKQLNKSKSHANDSKVFPVLFGLINVTLAYGSANDSPRRLLEPIAGGVVVPAYVVQQGLGGNELWGYEGGEQVLH